MKKAEFIIFLLLVFPFTFSPFVSTTLIILCFALWYFSDEIATVFYYFLSRKNSLDDFSVNQFEDLRIVRFNQAKSQMNAGEISSNENDGERPKSGQHNQHNNIRIIHEEEINQNGIIVPLQYSEPPNSQKPSFEYLIKATTRNIISDIVVKKKKSGYYSDKSGVLTYLFYISFKTKLTKQTALKTCKDLIELSHKV
jgi:hypothetical protein